MPRNPFPWAASAAILAVAGFVCWNLAASHEVIKAQKGAATQAAHEEAQKTRDWLRGEVLDKTVMPALRDLGSGLDAHGKALEAKLDTRLGRIESDADKRLGDALTRYDATLAAANQRVGEGTAALKTAANSLQTAANAIPPLAEKAGDTIAALRPGFENASLMARNVNQALAPMLDCRDNAACLPSETTGILGSAKTLFGESALTARAWRKESPQMAANVRGITGNAEKLSRPSKLMTVAKYGATIGTAAVAIWAAKKGH